MSTVNTIKDFTNSEIIEELEDRNFTSRQISDIGQIFDLVEEKELSECKTDELLAELYDRDLEAYQDDLRGLITDGDGIIEVSDTVFGNGLWNEEIGSELHRLLNLHSSDKLLSILENIK